MNVESILRAKNVGALVVVSNDAILGIISERCVRCHW
jgi:hypothetical protein